MALIKVKKSPIHGLGVFASQDIPEGTRIIEYLGEKISKEEEVKREKENDKKGVTYIFDYNKKFSIDGAVEGSDAKYVNHSCDPNCDCIRRNGRVFYYSNRLIRKGEELTIDYAYDKNDPLEVCHCGSKKCRGYINETYFTG